MCPSSGTVPSPSAEILKQHPKGKEYGFINEGQPLHPLLTDSTGAILSYPPIINSADLGAVQVGDSELFIEITGTDLSSVLLSANIIACDLADMGHKIEPVAVEYPYDCGLGTRLTCPWYFQKPVSIESTRAAKPPWPALFRRRGLRGRLPDGLGGRDPWPVRDRGSPAEYRNDFLHPVDVVEDVMIGFGMDAFKSREAPGLHDRPAFARSSSFPARPRASSWASATRR